MIICESFYIFSIIRKVDSLAASKVFIEVKVNNLKQIQNNTKTSLKETEKLSSILIAKYVDTTHVIKISQQYQI